MKLIMENWNHYLLEEEIEKRLSTADKLTEDVVSTILAEVYREKGMTLTEAQLNEEIPRWLKKMGKFGAGAAMLASLAGPMAPGVVSTQDLGPADSADAPAMQMQAQSDYSQDILNALIGYISGWQQSRDSLSDRADAAHEMTHINNALNDARMGDSSGLDNLDTTDQKKLDSIAGKVAEMQQNDAELFNHFLVKGQQTAFGG